MRISVTVTVMELRSLNMRRMRIWHSPFSSICQKNPKELKSPKKNGILKKKVDGVVEMNRKYEISTKENREFLKASCEDLLNFGHRFPSPNGGSYYLGDDGTPWKDRNRETWITCRMAHVYSLGLMLGHEGSGELVDAALKGLKGELHDEKNGGWYAGVTPEGDIVPNKQCYAHAFVILAASSALIAGRSGAEELLEEALAVYDQYFWNEEEGLACDTWNTEFTVLDDYRGLNANMHTVEAFLAAGDVIGDKKYHIRAGRIIDHVIGWAEDNNWRIPEHFTKEWVADLDCNRDVRMIRSSHMERHRAMESNGQD